MPCGTPLCASDFSAENIDRNGVPIQFPGEALYYRGDFIPTFGIASGDDFNVVLMKMAAYFATQTPPEPTTTTTTTSTSTTTSTTTTEGTTTSTTTSTTTTVVLDSIYYGAKDTYGSPSELEIAAGTVLNANASGDITIPFNTLPAGKFYWFFIPTKLNSMKNAWVDTVLPINNGGIGTEDETFGPYSARMINSVGGSVSSGQFATTFANPIRLTINS